MEYDINKILLTQQGRYNKNKWTNMENKIGITFPEDYKMFIDFYGSGGINGFLWILSPFCKNDNLNSIEKFELMKSAYNSMKNESSKRFLYDFYNGNSGLFPWGITDNGDELFWNFNDNFSEIVVYGSRYTESVNYLMGMEEFLYKLLNREIICPIFPDDFILAHNYYEVI